MAGALTAASQKKHDRPGLVRRRIAFGLLISAGVLGLLWIDTVTRRGYGTAAICGFAMVFGLREVLRMLTGVARPAGVVVALSCGPAIILVQLMQRSGPYQHLVPRDADHLVLIGCVLLLWTVGLSREPTREHLTGLLVTTFGMVYVLLLGSFAVRLRFFHELLPRRLHDPELGMALLLYAIVGAKGTDIFAFFTGRAFGRRKLIPHVSPGKTVAGGFGALAGAVLITLGFLEWSSLGSIFTWSVALPLGILVGVTSMVGDLVESLVKRSSRVKDSGALVPEFGGVMDIIDSVLFVMPVVYTAALVAIRLKYPG